MEKHLNVSLTTSQIFEIYRLHRIVSCRQHKLEEALLFSGRFTDALQALNDWLYRAEPQLAEDVPVGGDKDMVHNLIDKHKVQRDFVQHGFWCQFLCHSYCSFKGHFVSQRLFRKSWESERDVLGH